MKKRKLLKRIRRLERRLARLEGEEPADVIGFEIPIESEADDPIQARLKRKGRKR